jgi:hypothetical protein
MSTNNPLYRAFNEIGLASYSIYLWHWPIPVYLRYLVPGMGAAPILLGLAASLAAGIASYHFIERPSQRVLRRLDFGRNVLIAGAAAAPVFLIRVASPLLIGVTPNFANAPAAVWRAILDAKKDIPSKGDCTFFTAGGDINAGRFAGAADIPRKFLVFGDSHAQMWRPRLQALEKEKALGAASEIYLAAAPSCPPLPNLNTLDNPCGQFFDKAMDFVKSEGIDEIVALALGLFQRGTHALPPAGRAASRSPRRRPSSRLCPISNRR